MAHNLPALQQKAVSLRDYMHQNNIKNTLQSALPKWMSADRLLRIVFTTAMKNPKILDCTRESILSSVMQCAQLGLEPILGRAYLIPYNNTKYVAGKMEKVLECQFQPGYQGLVDLARRTDTIADVWGFNVYEADEFNLTYGNNPNIDHIPWHIDSVKRKEKKPGEIIGAYVVWQLKDGTKHIEYMPIHDIHKRRAKSQAYQWAETGDPRRGGGKQDSVWHEWPEEQNLKTVIKHSSKLVPSSIEFMQAVELDEAADLGKNQIGMFTDTPNFEGLLPESASTIDVDALKESKPQMAAENSVPEMASPAEQSEETDSHFAELIKKQTGKDFEFKPSIDGQAQGLLSAYIEMSADHQVERLTPYQMMEAIGESPGIFPGFWNGFENGTWKKHFSGKLPPEPDEKDPEGQEPATGTGGGGKKENKSDTNAEFDKLIDQIPKDEQSHIPGYLGEQANLGQCTTKEVMEWAIANENDFTNGLNGYIRKQKKEAPTESSGPQQTDWDPYNEEVGKRYTADKQAVLKSEAAKWNIKVSKKLPRDVHAEILEAKKKADEEAAAAATNETDGEEEDQAFSDDPETEETEPQSPREPGDESENENGPVTGEAETSIDYGTELQKLCVEDESGLMAACKAIGMSSDFVVIPLAPAKRKELYEKYLESKG